MRDYVFVYLKLFKITLILILYIHILIVCRHYNFWLMPALDFLFLSSKFISLMVNVLKINH